MHLKTPAHIGFIVVFLGLLGLTSAAQANVVPDPSFETGTANWVLGDYASSIVSTPTRTGSKALKLINDFDGTQVPAHNAGQYRINGVVAGREYVYTVWVKGNNVQGIGTGGKPLVVVRWRNAANQTIRKEMYNWAPYGTYDWQQMRLHMQAPSGAAGVDVSFRSWWDCIAGVTYWDDVSLTPRDFGNRGSLLNSYQAETANTRSGGSVHSTHTDYTGSGYFDVTSTGAILEWTNVAGGGNRVVAARYSWEGNAQNVELFVNGASQGTIRPKFTGRRGSWASINWNVNLPSGNNTVRLKIGKKGGEISQPMIDRLEVYAAGGGTPPPPPPPPPSSPPGNVAASYDTFTDKVMVSWNSVSGATRYEVYRSTTVGNNGSLRASPTGTSYNDTNAAAGTDYYYSVKACNAGGCSGFSAQDVGRRAVPAGGTPPAVPTGVSASDGTFTNRVAVSWGAVNGATTYRVFRSTASGNNGTRIATPTGTSYNDSGATAGTNYYYRVRACNANGCSGFSTQDVGYKAVAAGTPPPAPANVSASDSTFTNRIEVNWGSVSGATKYEVYRATAAGNNGGRIASPTGTSYNDTNATAGRNYYYRVKACNADGCSGFSTQDVGRRKASAAENLPPRVQLDSTQSGMKTRWVAGDSGNVQVSTLVTDPNAGDSHTFDWSQSDNALVPAEGFNADTFTFDPSVVAPGVYVLRVTVEDSGTPTMSSSAEMMLRVVDSLPALSNTNDTDDDGMDDASEGYADSDNDGIPDFQDAVADPDVLQGKPLNGVAYLLRTNAGLILKQGQTAFASSQASASISTQDISNHGGNSGSPGANADDSNYSYPVGIYDFEIVDLPLPGQSVIIVIPLADAIAEGAIYRKYVKGIGWQDFHIDQNNGVASAQGALGVCPPPGDNAYVPGLVAGYYCVQLTIEDGGPNDADGQVNSAVSDPSGVALPNSVGASSGGGGGCSFNSNSSGKDVTFYLLIAISLLYLGFGGGFRRNRGKGSGRGLL